MMFYLKSAFALMAAFMVGHATAGGEGETKTRKASTAVHRARKLQALTPTPIQTFYVPFGEDFLYNEIYLKISHHPAQVKSVENIVSISISTDKTVIWWDHWEDGYDIDVVTGAAFSTDVWGDGDASNGCAPDVVDCKNNDDYLMAGRSIVIQDTVQIPRDKQKRHFDGGDRIMASLPIAVTRAGFPTYPGSEMAGSVEVLDTDSWGTEYEAPVGQNYPVGTNLNLGAFELSGLYFMAGFDNTLVTLRNGTSYKLKSGQGMMVNCRQGDTLHATKPIQVDFMTGKLFSVFQLRWFSLRPLSTLASSYFSPVGDSKGKTKLLLYNPHPAKLIDFMVHTLVNGTVMKYSEQLLPKQMVLSRVIPTGSGAWVNGTDKFIALSYTDTEVNDGDNSRTNGQIYDWGFPLVPRDELTSQVLISWGYACKFNKCMGAEDRSVVWLSAVEDADVYIDYYNTGVNQKKISVKALQSVKITDSDQDMSGAVIFAVKTGGPKYGEPVDIAVAWGQDPLVSGPLQPISMDLGTTVLPLPLVKVKKMVDKAIFVAGDELLYTIRVMNIGQKKLETLAAILKDTLDSDVTYIDDSTSLSSSTGVVGFKVADSASPGSAFPLDDDGYAIPLELFRRGGAIDVTFKVKVSTTTKKSKIVNKGVLVQGNFPDIPFEVFSTRELLAEVAITNKVYIGTDAGKQCGTGKEQEQVEDLLGTNVTYCFEVTNTGKSHLGDVMISNAELLYNLPITGLILAPRETKMVFVDAKILGPLVNNAVVVANPVLPNGDAIPDIADVTATDPSQVSMLTFKASINITNTAHLSWDNGKACNTNATFESVREFLGWPVTHCFTVTNDGNTHLASVVIVNNELNFTRTIGNLAPKEKVSISLSAAITSGNVINVAIASGTPVSENGLPLQNLSPVSSIDTALVNERIIGGTLLKVTNVVYLGHDKGAKCLVTLNSATSKHVSIPALSVTPNDLVTYCFRVRNSGGQPMAGVTLTVPELNISRVFNGVRPPLTTPGVLLGTLIPGGGSSVLVNTQWDEFLESRVESPLRNVAYGVGQHSTPTGVIAPNTSPLLANDFSSVGISFPRAAIQITNMINTLTCQSAACCDSSANREHLEGVAGTTLNYCFIIRNVGNTGISNLTITNPEILGAMVESRPLAIAPQATVTVLLTRPLNSTFVNNATVVGIPCTISAGKPCVIPNLNARVQASDPSSQRLIPFTPSISITNTVYKDLYNPSFCRDAVEHAEGTVGTVVMYCLNVTNTGNTFLIVPVITCPRLNYTFTLGLDDNGFRPGMSILWPIPRTITETLMNDCTVTAIPNRHASRTNMTLDLPGIPNVNATDGSSVGLIQSSPSITIDNTVYIGKAESEACDQASEMVKDFPLTDVVYCLKITNTGDMYLTDMTIIDKELNFSSTSKRVWAPNTWDVVLVPGKIQDNLINTAVVTAKPATQFGVTVSGYDAVTASDPSEVQKIHVIANITVANTVYLGHNGDAKCGTSTESVTDFLGSLVTYCFKITNIGETHLSSITVDNGDLPYTTDLTLVLGPKESATVTFPSKIEASLNNTVVVSATPVFPDGKVMPGIAAVTANDPSNVEMKKLVPGIAIVNTVYLGVDGGKSCATAVETVQDRYGAPVTYCLKITNTGESHLEHILLNDTVIDFTSSDFGILAPKESVTVTVPGKITGNATNEATVIGFPCLEDGSDILGQNPVNASDPSSVLEVAHKPSINIENTVYVGKSDGGAKCANASETVRDFPMTEVVYCFEIKNTGDSHLKDVVVTNVDLVNFKDESIKSLSIGETKIIAVAGKISADVKNTAMVTATPSLVNGTPLPKSEQVRDSDPSAVEIIPYTATIDIDNTVYIGKDYGAQCGTSVARDLAQGLFGTEVTYCFNVTNVDITTLNDVVITNKELNFTKKLTKPLAPGEYVVLHLEKTIFKDLTNNATVSGNPVTNDLEDIVELDDVTSDDLSAVDKFDFVGSINILNTVYLGSTDEGAKCGTDSAVEQVSGTYGTPVTYCFTIINTGETHLASIVLTNDDFKFKKDILKTLAPRENVTVSLPGMITNGLVNDAIVKANPVTDTGTDIPDHDDVSSTDPSEVKIVDSEAKIAIANTVYLGTDGGKKCGTSAASELAIDYLGESVTYCFEVTNTGKSFLTNVVLTNDELKYDGKITEIMKPNSTVTLFVDGTVTGTVENVVNVSGTPSLEDGTVIPLMTDVTASDPSGIQMIKSIPLITIDNTVVLGCGYGEEIDSACSRASQCVDTYIGECVTYCFKVTNQGQTHLSQVVVKNAELNFTDESIGTLAPGESTLAMFESTLGGKLTNVAVATGNPVDEVGNAIPNTKTVTSSDDSCVTPLPYSASIIVSNTVYIGSDNGAMCSISGVEKVTDMNQTSIVYCFNITNNGDTPLVYLSLHDPELNYVNNAISPLAPRESTLVAFPSKIVASITNNVVVTGTPASKTGSVIPGAPVVSATDPSEVALKVLGDEKQTNKTTFDPPGPPGKCMNDNWKDSGKNSSLVCATKEVYLSSLSSNKTLSCKAGDKISITVDGTIRVEGRRSDLGWYVATDGGDALNGTCVVNGLQSGNTYNFVSSADKTKALASAAWGAVDGGDNDRCGDVVFKGTGSADLTIPFVVNTTVTCLDETDDGQLDFAVCFTWRSDESNGACNFERNIPGKQSGECFCTRYNVPNVTVVPKTPEKPC